MHAQQGQQSCGPYTETGSRVQITDRLFVLVFFMVIVKRKHGRFGSTDVTHLLDGTDVRTLNLHFHFGHVRALMLLSLCFGFGVGVCYMIGTLSQPHARLKVGSYARGNSVNSTDLSEGYARSQESQDTQYSTA